MDDDIDTSWIDRDAERLQKEPMESLPCCFIFVSTGAEDSSCSRVQRVVNERVPLVPLPSRTSESSVGIPKEHLLHMIQSKRQPSSSSKYRLSNLVLYNVVVDDIQSYAQSSEYVALSQGYLTEIPFLDEMVVPPSFAIFHDINCLYVIFREIPASLPKPILKIHSEYGGTGKSKIAKKTKRVAFRELDLRHTKKLRG